MGALLDSLHEQTGFPHWFSPRVPVRSHRCLVPLSYVEPFIVVQQHNNKLVLLLPGRNLKQKNPWAFVSLRSVHVFQWWFGVWNLLVLHLLPESPSDGPACPQSPHTLSCAKGWCQVTAHCWGQPFPRAQPATCTAAAHWAACTGCILQPYGDIAGHNLRHKNC